MATKPIFSALSAVILNCTLKRPEEGNLPELSALPSEPDRISPLPFGSGAPLAAQRIDATAQRGVVRRIRLLDAAELVHAAHLQHMQRARPAAP